MKYFSIINIDGNETVKFYDDVTINNNEYSCWGHFGVPSKKIKPEEVKAGDVLLFVDENEGVMKVCACTYSKNKDRHLFYKTGCYEGTCEGYSKAGALFYRIKEFGNNNNGVIKAMEYILGRGKKYE